MGSTSLIFRSPPYCEGLQSLASTESIIVSSDAWPFNYDAILLPVPLPLFEPRDTLRFLPQVGAPKELTGPITVNGRFGSLKEYLDVG